MSDQNSANRRTTPPPPRRDPIDVLDAASEADAVVTEKLAPEYAPAPMVPPRGPSKREQELEAENARLRRDLEGVALSIEQQVAAAVARAVAALTPAAGTPPHRPALPGVLTPIRAPLTQDEEQVEVKVSPWGHGQISTGDHYGMSHYPDGAIITCALSSAHSLWKKKWAMPTDKSLADRFAKIDRAAMARGSRQKQEQLKELEGAYMPSFPDRVDERDFIPAN